MQDYDLKLNNNNFNFKNQLQYEKYIIRNDVAICNTFNTSTRKKEEKR